MSDVQAILLLASQDVSCTPGVKQVSRREYHGGMVGIWFCGIINTKLLPSGEQNASLMAALNKLREDKGLPPLPFPALVISRTREMLDRLEYEAESSGRITGAEGSNS